MVWESSGGKDDDIIALSPNHPIEVSTLIMYAPKHMNLCACSNPTASSVVQVRQMRRILSQRFHYFCLQTTKTKFQDFQASHHPPAFPRPVPRPVPRHFHTSQDRPGRRSKMSWMDSWSRPSKHQATPAPYYLIPGGESTPYCHSCGRVISSRRTDKTTDAASTAVKYCSSRCRSHKPGKLDKDIESVFVGLLNGTVEAAGEQGGDGGSPKRERAQKAKKPGGGGKKKVKGDARLLVSCDEVERHMFGHQGEEGDAAGSATSGSQHGDEDTHANHANGHVTQSADNHYDGDHATGTLEDPTFGSTAGGYIDGDVLARMSVRSGTRIRPPQSVSEVNGSVGGEKGRAERIEETDTMLEKRKEGMRRAKHREMVRCAARRGVVFGFGDGENKRKCEAIMLGKVVEPSFAKGDWSIRWRE